jgi:two-component system, OmpR family, copper resistance phosphate regulon response regulator CusR
MRILVVEDDEPLALFLQKGLAAQSYSVALAGDGDVAIRILDQSQYELVVLDLNLPTTDGLEVLKHIRSKGYALPVLVLSSRRQLEDRVGTLDLGADDYLAKPFAFSELSARIRALIRRSGRPVEMTLRVADLEFNRVEHNVNRGGKPIELTPKELALLEYLMGNAGQCVTRAMIVEKVWRLSADTMTNVVDVYINYLRKKIDEGFDTKLIHTVRGVGYRLGSEKHPAALIASA